MQLTKKETQEKKQLYVGFSEVDIISVSPNKEELIKLLGITEDKQEEFKEPSYESEKDGNQTVRLDFWVKSKKTNNLDKITFFLENTPRVSKDGNKNEYINQLGATQFVDSEDNLFDNFKAFQNVLSWIKDGNVTPKWVAGAKPNEVEVVEKKSYRKALKGESELMEFLKNALTGIDYRAFDTNLLLDMKKLFSGNFKELQQLIGNDLTSVVVCYAVKTVEKDGETKDYQSISNKYFSQGVNMKLFRNFKYDNTTLEGLAGKVESKKATPVEKLIYESSFGDYKIKDFFIPSDLQPYSDDLNPISIGADHEPSATGSDY